MGDGMKHTADFPVSSATAAPSIVGSTPPRIAINGRFLTQRASGVQRFASETIKAIDALLDTEAYGAFKGRIEILAPQAARDFPLKNIAMRRCGRFSGYFWEQIEFPLHAYGQLLLNLCMLGPVATRHQVVVVHDATVRALPDNFSPAFRAAYGILIPLLCWRAACAATVSQFSRREIGKWYGVNVDAMPVCLEGADHITQAPADTAVLDRFGLAGKKYFLGVGVGSSNKNIETVLAAFERSKLDDTLLVLTGKRDARVHGHLTEVDAAAVRNVGFVSDAELRALYEHAIALVFPSRYEGFGLPPIEAMQCGCPVIISDQPALVEVCGDAALRCGMDDVDQLTRLMRNLHSDSAFRAGFASAGRAHAGQFTWAATARRLLGYCMGVG
jgi:glycosyltransferase involved in cell wall biosynthesis